MDKSIFVQNIKDICKRMGIKPTVACRESGVSASFINNIEAKGQVPSVEKVQMLASYLGVTTSELLGEKIEPALVTEVRLNPRQQQLVDLFDAASPDIQSAAFAVLESADVVQVKGLGEEIVKARAKQLGYELVKVPVKEPGGEQIVAQVKGPADRQMTGQIKRRSNIQAKKIYGVKKGLGRGRGGPIKGR